MQLEENLAILNKLVSNPS